MQNQMFAQSMLSDYDFEKKAFVYDIWSFDSLITIMDTNSNCSLICIEKENLPMYADKSSEFYSFWEFYPNSYRLMSVADAKYIDEFAIHSISDTFFLKHWNKEFFSNGVPVFAVKSVVSEEISYYQNIKYHNVLCNTFLVLLVPAKRYFYDVYKRVFTNPSACTSAKEIFFHEYFADGLYEKMLYPMFSFEEQ